MTAPTPASTVLIIRDAPELEVMMVARHSGLAFGAGAWVFPGGKVAGADHDPAWRELSSGDWGHTERALRIAAARETFEESGLLLARDRSGAAPTADCLARLAPRREAVEAEPALFLELLRAEGLSLDLASLTPFAHWITPSFEPRRYDTHFFLAMAPDSQIGQHDGRETVDLHWVRPAEVLERRARGEAKLMFPTRLNLEKLGRARDCAGAVSAACASIPVTVEPQIIEEDGRRFLEIPEAAGYGLTLESLDRVMG